MFTRWVQEKIKNAMSSWLIFLFFRQSATENARITSGRPVTDQIESKLHNIIKLYKNFLSGYMIGFIHRPRPPLWAAGFTFGEYGSQKVRYEPHRVTPAWEQALSSPDKKLLDRCYDGVFQKFKYISESTVTDVSYLGHICSVSKSHQTQWLKSMYFNLPVEPLMCLTTFFSFF